MRKYAYKEARACQCRNESEEHVSPTYLAESNNHEQQTHDADLDPGPDVAHICAALDVRVGRVGKEILTCRDGGRVSCGGQDDPREGDGERDQNQDHVDASTDVQSVTISVCAAKGSRRNHLLSLEQPRLLAIHAEEADDLECSDENTNGAENVRAE